MSEHDETLQKVLEENAQLRSDREESLREASSGEFSKRLRFAERVYWVYSMVCVVVFVSAFHLFLSTFDVKTLIACAVVMLVVYETTVLMKLWFATTGMKMSVLKDVKLLRLEVARLASAAGVERPSEPPVKYEPMRGASPWERRLWLAALVIVAIAASSMAARQFLTGNNHVTDETLVTLAEDGSATTVTEMTQTYDSLYRPKSFPYYAPKAWKIRFVDAQGEEMPVTIIPEEKHNRHLVTLTEGIYSEGRMRYTRISQAPGLATVEDGVWTYKNDIQYSTPENRFRVIVCLPAGATLVSAEPAPTLEFEQDGRTAVRFQATRGKNERFAYAVSYSFPATEN